MLFSGTAVAQSEEDEAVRRIEAEAKRHEMESSPSDFEKPRNAWKRLRGELLK
jgi:hypothetical protein